MAKETQAPLPESREPRKIPRVPPSISHFNVNFCKNPACQIFGIPFPEVGEKGPGAKNIYTVVT